MRSASSGDRLDDHASASRLRRNCCSIAARSRSRSPTTAARRHFASRRDAQASAATVLLASRISTLLSGCGSARLGAPRRSRHRGPDIRLRMAPQAKVTSNVPRSSPSTVSGCRRVSVDAPARSADDPAALGRAAGRQRDALDRKPRSGARRCDCGSAARAHRPRRNCRDSSAAFLRASARASAPRAECAATLRAVRRCHPSRSVYCASLPISRWTSTRSSAE